MVVIYLEGPWPHVRGQKCFQQDKLVAEGEFVESAAGLVHSRASLIQLFLTVSHGGSYMAAGAVSERFPA